MCPGSYQLRSKDAKEAVALKLIFLVDRFLIIKHWFEMWTDARPDFFMTMDQHMLTFKTC